MLTNIQFCGGTGTYLDRGRELLLLLVADLVVPPTSESDNALAHSQPSTLRLTLSLSTGSLVVSKGHRI